MKYTYVQSQLFICITENTPSEMRAPLPSLPLPPPSSLLPPQRTVSRERELFDFSSDVPPILLILDRRDDPVTPLLNQVD